MLDGVDIVAPDTAREQVAAAVTDHPVGTGPAEHAIFAVRGRVGRSVGVAGHPVLTPTAVEAVAGLPGVHIVVARRAVERVRAVGAGAAPP